MALNEDYLDNLLKGMMPESEQNIEEPELEIPEPQAEEPELEISELQAEESELEIPEPQAEEPELEIPELQAEEPESEISELLAEEPEPEISELLAEEQELEIPELQAEEPEPEMSELQAEEPELEIPELQAEEQAPEEFELLTEEGLEVDEVESEPIAQDVQSEELSEESGKAMSVEEIDSLFESMEATGNEDANTDSQGSSLEDLLNEMKEEDSEDEEIASDFAEADFETPNETGDLPNYDDMDVTDMISGIEGDDDLSEISGLLKKSDNNELVDNEDILNILEGTIDSEENEEDDIFANLFQEDTEGEPEEEGNKRRRKEKVKKERVKKERVKKERRGRKDKSGAQADRESIEDLGIEDNGEIQEIEIGLEFDDIPDRTPTKKKIGFFGKILNALTEEDEEDDALLGSLTDENATVLDELDKEDQQGGKKKGKKEKKVKKGKKGKGEEEGEEEDGTKKEKAPKPKKEKKPKKVKAAEPAKPEKKLSKKKVIATIFFCATLTAAIIAVCTFIPDDMNKKSARDAYHDSDYKTVFELFYDKKLNESDNIIYQRARVISQMDRKLEAYENYKKMEMPLESLNALLEGVEVYSILLVDDVYGAEENIKETYQKITQILSSDYGISEEDAITILGYDNITYTKKLSSYVYGTEFAESSAAGSSGNTPEVGPSENDTPKDILREEELFQNDIMESSEVMEQREAEEELIENDSDN